MIPQRPTGPNFTTAQPYRGGAAYRNFKPVARKKQILPKQGVDREGGDDLRGGPVPPLPKIKAPPQCPPALTTPLSVTLSYPSLIPLPPPLPVLAPASSSSTSTDITNAIRANANVMQKMITFQAQNERRSEWSLRPSAKLTVCDPSDLVVPQIDFGKTERKDKKGGKNVFV